MVKQSALAAIILAAGAAHAAELYSNGPVVNGSGKSVLTRPDTTYGFGAQTPEADAVADDFDVGPLGWTVERIDVYAYQTGAGAFTFSDVSWSIVSGDVNTGSVIASGTTAATNGGLEGYRVTSTTRNNRDRAIFDVQVDIADVVLATGHYWLRYSLAGSDAFSGPWVPPTSDGRMGNAQQALGGAAFAPALDGGSGDTVELPFVLSGTVNAVPEPATAAMLVGGLALLAARRLRRG